MNTEIIFLHSNNSWQDFQEKYLNELEVPNPLTCVSI